MVAERSRSTDIKSASKGRIFLYICETIYYSIMQTLELKSRIQSYLEKADDRILRIINSVFENYYGQDEDGKIVGRTIQGEPITKAQYIERIKQAEKNIEAGNYTTHEDLFEEMKKWE